MYFEDYTTVLHVTQVKLLTYISLHSTHYLLFLSSATIQLKYILVCRFPPKLTFNIYFHHKVIVLPVTHEAIN